MTDFYVYSHARKDGRVFYIGKGSDRRAWDFSPSRRKEWHLRILKKDGRQNIAVKTYPTSSEAEAFELERFLIAEHRLSGKSLINLTDGGEGCSGRQISDKVREAFKLGRGKEHYARMSDDAKQRIRAGLVKVREKMRAWQKTDAGKAHFKNLVAAGMAAREKMSPRKLTCPECQENFETKSFRAIYCGKICWQRTSRRRRKLRGSH